MPKFFEYDQPHSTFPSDTLFASCGDKMREFFEERQKNRPLNLMVIGSENFPARDDVETSKLEFSEGFYKIYPDKDFPKLKEVWRAKGISYLQSFDLVLVERKGRNFQLTNHIFPQVFKNNRQWCRWFAFW